MNVTLEDIAQLAGVSRATASRALRDSPLVNAATKERIKAIAAAQNYQPNLLAKSLRLQRTQTVTLVLHSERTDLPSLSDPFMLKLMGLTGAELKKRGQDMLVVLADCRDPQLGNQYVRSGRSDGLIVVGRPTDDSGLRSMAADGVPVVTWGIPTPDAPYASVGIDNHGLTQAAVRHVAQHGRQTIGFIGTGDGCAEFNVRFAGYRAGLAEAGLAYAEERVALYGEIAQSPTQWVGQLLQHTPQLDGLFVCSDVMAIEAIDALRGLGRRVPEDVAVIGFDNIDIGAYTRPALTTVGQGLTTGGAAKLVEQMLGLIDGASPTAVTVPGRLIIRASCGSHE